ncbi:glutamate-cysteine ligase catalytic subunit [Multifurca ochricompacta]|uniref:Glutamate--cysteine ligase n=1 Tax=Multifurca ochricompacta TaxID=376703 RepID=A0AAD4QL67_9AGAM|nr:glutamate-cysteine ligase catalytic subunit [Multifurca ochricompacta]
MGLLSLGTPLHWDQAKHYAEHVRYHGISQFLNTWDRLKDRQGDELLWGDEVEYMVIQLDTDNKDAVLSLCQTEVLAKLQALTDDMNTKTGSSAVPPVFHPEYGRYMLESTPGAPYSGSVHDLLLVESNMRLRRHLARSNLKPDQIPITLTSFPRMGVPGKFTEPYYDPTEAVSSHSLFLPEQITNPHARFPTLTANIRRRRKSKVAINLPIFIDNRTPRPFIDPTTPWHRDVFPEDAEARNGAALIDHIYMDAMGFGMGCCCLQLTFQCCNIDQSRRMYDALIPIGPIMLALTAASPLWRGYIADVDCRWNVIAGSVDDRTEEERGLKPLKENRMQIPKSRYDSVDLYISETWMNRPEYNDNPLPIDQSLYDRMRKHGIDDLLSKHIAHMFIRDPIVIFSELIDQDDTKSTDHFENIQSTNWQTLRFKPPPPNSPIGWRVEFRSMEVQMTDFENAAFAVFIVLLSRAIMSMNINLYIPISKVDENMRRAQQRDAVNQAKFYFRREVFTPASSRATSGATTPNGVTTFSYASSTISGASPNGNGTTNGLHHLAYPNGCPRRKQRVMENCFPPPPPPDDGLAGKDVSEEYAEYTMNEIISGRGDAFPGLIGLVEAYLDTLDLNDSEQRRITSYLNLIRRRANGSLKTAAAWTRDFVRSHPSYNLIRSERGVRRAPDLLPEDYTGSNEDPSS